MRSALALLLLVVTIASGQVTPTLVPFGGITAGARPPVSLGQVVTGISDITALSFDVAAVSGPGGDTASACIAQWVGSSPSTAIGCVSVTLPVTTAGYVTVTANLKVQRLDPIANYVIYISVTSNSKYELFTQFSSAIGGFVQGVGSVWQSGFSRDARFSFAFDSVLPLNSDLNFAQSHNPGWACKVNTTFSCIQVNWQTMLANTGYAPCITKNTVVYGPSYCTSTYAPYGAAAACWDLQYQQAWSYSNADISGTPYKFGPDAWRVAAGFLADGYARYSNNNQSVAIAGSGDCGATYVLNSPDEITPAFCLPIVRVYTASQN